MVCGVVKGYSRIPDNVGAPWCDGVRRIRRRSAHPWQPTSVWVSSVPVNRCSARGGKVRPPHKEEGGATELGAWTPPHLPSDGVGVFFFVCWAWYCFSQRSSSATAARKS